ncbi:MAG: RsmD family RNA methyltransferase [Acidobacteriota bacterium]
MTGLRITGGDLRGRRISAPSGNVRPTSGRARQAFFNIVGARIQDAVFLDLFAGSGVFSFEAVSRNARLAIAMDQSRKSVQAIQRMAQEWDVPITAIAADAILGLKRLDDSLDFGIVYADPPYAYPDYQLLVDALDSFPRMAVEAIVGIEHRKGPIPFDWQRLRRLSLSRTVAYGDVAITFLEVAAA